MEMMGTRSAFWAGGPRGWRMSREERRERGREEFGGEHGRRHGGRGGFEGRGRYGGHSEEGPEFEPRGHHGRRRGRDGARVGRGDVRAALLLLLVDQPSHGYHLMQRVSERSGGVWQPSPGSVYPALQLLEDEGLVRVEQSEGRRVFHLTDSGQAYVQEHHEELTNAWSAVVGSVDDSEQELRGLFQQVGTALRQVMHEGTAAQIASARTLLVNTRRQLYRILAEEDGSDAD